MINLSKISFIKDKTGNKAVVLPLGIYEEIKSKIKKHKTIRNYIIAKSKVDLGLPVELLESLLSAKESKLKIIREFRGFSINELADTMGVSRRCLSQLEDNKNKGNMELYRKISTALDVDIELLI